MNKKNKDTLVGILVTAIFIIAIVWLLITDTNHIEDTNGSSDYSLTTITNENIINLDLGAIGVPQPYTNSFTVGGINISSGIEFSSKKYTGVSEILYTNYLTSSDFEIDLHSFTVDKGNFKMVVVHNDEIVATLEPGEAVNYRLEDVSGNISLRIAGESASFSFIMDETDYNNFYHN